MIGGELTEVVAAQRGHLCSTLLLSGHGGVRLERAIDIVYRAQCLLEVVQRARIISGDAGGIIAELPQHGASDGLLRGFVDHGQSLGAIGVKHSDLLVLEKEGSHGSCNDDGFLALVSDAGKMDVSNEVVRAVPLHDDVTDVVSTISLETTDFVHLVCGDRRRISEQPHNEIDHMTPEVLLQVRRPS